MWLHKNQKITLNMVVVREKKKRKGHRNNIYTLKRVSDPSANISVTVLMFIHISLANRIGFSRLTSAMGAVL